MIGEVERQARVLDRVVPGWEHKIDADTLTFNGDGPSCHSLINDCVLGSWGNGRRYGINEDSSAYLGMCVFTKTRWVLAARRRLRRFGETLYVPQEWERHRERHLERSHV